MPTIEQIELDLPNGFHDAKLCKLDVDYERAEVTMTLNVLVSTPDNAIAPEYRRAKLTIRGVAFLSIDPPRAGVPVEQSTPLRIDAGAGQPSSAPIALPMLPPDCCLHWFFVNEWSGFIRVAARDAAFLWME